MMTNDKVKITMIPRKYIHSYELDDNLRERIKEYIKLKGLSQRKIAQLSNNQISSVFLGELLSGKKSVISKEKFEIIANILDLSSEELLTGLWIFE